ncbi:hypothetical protein [Hyperthermus butylicus]|uniref:Uncharacterized protein n=1 Tax=Hyperthermus butylicus (strain DSM 5456 / JCM 9403 / PLM1-5) TaxID=415426 RepID=A2BL28_HYPBU|nr:hypothetical protein [Hyperthermus butylicus]ABM80689.1 hypothetical protein Hbut_0838 [Hyperthermus butylicus DSM 5456]
MPLCSSDSRLLAVYELSPSYVLELRLGGETCAIRSGDKVVLTVDEDLFVSDIESSTLGETLASLLLLKPVETRNWEEYKLLAGRYLERLRFEEARRLQKLLQVNVERAYMADIYPAIARLSRLQHLYLWLRSPLNTALRSSKYYEWLRRLAKWPRFIRIADVIGDREEGKSRSVRFSALAQSLSSTSLISLIDPALLMEGFSVRPHPLLVDPLLLVRLDSAKLATRLLDFEEQLYALTGVKRLLDMAKSVMKQRVAAIRSVELVEVAGFRTAVIKRYRDVTAVKWIVAAITSLPLPKPRLNPLSRLNNEYYFNRLLAEKGFNVPEPILVDPRRRIAAYSYVEGTDLAAALQRSPLPPVYRELGGLLAAVHQEGIVLWDTNPSNFIDSPRGLYIVDLEQARRSTRIEDMAWDIAVAAYYPAIYSPREAAARARLIAEGYLHAGGSEKVIVEAAKPRYAAPFIVAVPPTTLEKTRKALLKATGSSS